MPLRQDVQDAFATLGLTPGADIVEATKSYKRLALLHHPDRNHNDPSATQRFQQIGHAWDICQKFYENPAWANRPEGAYYPDDDDDELDGEDLFDFYMFMFAETLFDRYNRARGQRYRHERSGHRAGPVVFTFSPSFFSDDSQERQEKNSARQKREKEEYEKRKRELELEIEQEERKAKEQARKQKADMDRVVGANERAFQAAHSGNSEEVRRLVNEFFLDVNAPRYGKSVKKQDESTQYESLLHAAACKCDESLFTFLLDKGADPNVLDKEHLSPFHVAIKSGNSKIVRFILEKRGKLFQDYHPSKATPLRRTPLQLAIESNDKATIELLVKHATTHDVERCWKAIDLSEEVKDILRTKKGFVPPGEGLDNEQTRGTSKKAQRQQELAQQKEARLAEEVKRAEINRQKKEERAAKRAVMEQEKAAKEEENRRRKAEEETEESQRKAEEGAKRQRMEKLRREEEEAARLKAEPDAKAKMKAERESKERAEREAKERTQREAKERAERDAKEKAEREEKKRAEREAAREKAEREAKEKAEREAKEKAEREAKERAEQERDEKETRERTEREAKERAEREVKERPGREAKKRLSDAERMRIQKQRLEGQRLQIEREKKERQRVLLEKEQRAEERERMERLEQWKAQTARAKEKQDEEEVIAQSHQATNIPESSTLEESRQPARPVLTDEQRQELKEKRKKPKAAEREKRKVAASSQKPEPSATVPQSDAATRKKSKPPVHLEQMDDRQRAKHEQMMKRRAEQSARDKERNRRIAEERRRGQVESQTQSEQSEYVPLTPVSTDAGRHDGPARFGHSRPVVLEPMFGASSSFTEDIQTCVVPDDLFQPDPYVASKPGGESFSQPPIIDEREPSTGSVTTVANNNSLTNSTTTTRKPHRKFFRHPKRGIP